MIEDDNETIDSQNTMQENKEQVNIISWTSIGIDVCWALYTYSSPISGLLCAAVPIKQSF